MRITPYARPQLKWCALGAVLLAAAAGGLAWRLHMPYVGYTAAAPLLLLGCVLWFFRDPARHPPSEPGLILAPADGLVTHVDRVESISVNPEGGPAEHGFLPGAAQRVSIFLSVLDVHVNRSPVAGKVAFREYRDGACLDARSDECHRKNARMDLGLEPSDPALAREVGRLVVRQISGLVARRIVCAVRKEARLESGQAYGMIKFGSRTSLFVPAAARVEWKIEPGDRVKAGETVLGVAKAPLDLPSYAVPTLALAQGQEGGS